jgi:hypothetical protein
MMQLHRSRSLGHDLSGTSPQSVMPTLAGASREDIQMK